MEIKPTYLFFPGGYNTTPGNLDLNIITGDKVYFATCFTLENIKELMLKDHEHHFWSADMLIVRDLSIETIRKAISEIVEAGNLNTICAYIRSFQTVYEGCDILEEELIDVSDSGIE